MATITTVEKIKLKFAPTTAATSTNPNGLPAPVDGIPQWSIEGDNTGGATLEPEADGMACQLVSGNTAQTVTVKCTADADLDAGSDTPENYRPIEAVIVVEVVAAEAAGALIATSDITPK